jgi:hypothetical protein
MYSNSIDWLRVSSCSLFLSGPDNRVSVNYHQAASIPSIETTKGQLVGMIRSEGSEDVEGPTALVDFVLYAPDVPEANIDDTVSHAGN